jgi:hypothetical protein
VKEVEMTSGEIGAVIFLALMVVVIVWKTRRHNGPINSDRDDVGYSGGDHIG